ncbi:hypothetical protein [Marinobacter sp. W-8]|uniref:hypothetical protein n=1 Tax=Marinobacter sp. W-8 TaxID=3369658 RepID=UPI0037C70AB6
MSVQFDGSGTIQIPEWVSTSGNFNIIISGNFNNEAQRIFGGNDVDGIDWAALQTNPRVQIRSDGGYTYLNFLAAPFAVDVEVELRFRSSTGLLELFRDGVSQGSVSLPSLSDYSINEFGGAYNLPMPSGSVISRLQLVDIDSAANSRDYQLNSTSGTVAVDSGMAGQNGTLVNFTDANSAWITSGHTITAADDITSEGQTATFTLSGNSAAPESATLNGTDVGTLTDQGSGVYSYTAPLIADDDTADLVVSVDGTTAGATIAYANSYDRDQLTHPATEAEYSENSLSYPNAYATTQPYEWKVIADANASVVTINWNALEADDGFHKNVASYATPVANGVTTVTLGVFVPETGQAYQFDRTITVSDGSVVVEGEGLWSELFRDPTEELFTELFR